MISSIVKPAITKAITPVASLALRCGITPNGVTWVGAIGVVASALYFYPRGELFIGTLLISFFALSDLFDGTMARLSAQSPSKWGGFLDSTIDRITDSVVLFGASLYLIRNGDPLSIVMVVTMVTGILVPYIRAQAEALNIDCSGGIAERAERLMIVLTAIGLDGLGVPYVLSGGIWLLAVLGIITVVQRVLIVKRAIK